MKILFTLLLTTILCLSLKAQDDRVLSYYGLVGWGVGTVVPTQACNSPSFFLLMPDAILYGCRAGHLVVTGSSGSTAPGGLDTAVQYNDALAFGGDATNFSYNKTTHKLTATGGFSTGPSTSILDGSINGYFLMTDSTSTHGVNFKFTTDAKLTLRNRANGADADLQVKDLVVNSCTGCDSGSASYPIISAFVNIALGSGTIFFAPGGNVGAGNLSLENIQSIVLPRDGTLSNLCILIGSGTQPSDGTLSCLVRKNNGDTTLVATIPISSVSPTTVCDNTHTVSITAGDRISYKVTNTASTDAAFLSSCTMLFQ